MRSAPTETALSRLLTSAYEQLDTIKSSYGQFYDMEHQIVDKYAGMIADEVNRYKSGMLDYFHVREVNPLADNPIEESSNRQFYTTSLAKTIYELSTDFEQIQTQMSPDIGDDEQTFLTEDTNSAFDNQDVPFAYAFRLPSNLVHSILYNQCRAFLDYYDQWQEETCRRAEAVMYSKHDELDKEMDFQMHLHEPRRIRIETDIHNVRAGSFEFIV